MPRNPKPVLNFRVSHSLLAAIDELGKQLYPTPARKDSKLTYDRTSALNDIIEAGIAALSNGEIVGQKNNPNSLTEARVEELISNAISNLPSITEGRVEELISNAIRIANKITKANTEKIVADTISPLIKKIEASETVSSLNSVANKITRSEVAQMITETIDCLALNKDDNKDYNEDDIEELINKAVATATTPLQEKISNIESTIATRLDGDKRSKLSPEIDGADRKSEESSGGKTLYQMKREHNAPSYIDLIYRDGRRREVYNDTPAPRWLCEEYIERARNPRGDADAGLGADPIDYEIKSALHRISDLDAWYREVKKFKEWKPNPQEEWKRRYFSGEIQPEFLLLPTPSTPVPAEEVHDDGDDVPLSCSNGGVSTIEISSLVSPQQSPPFSQPDNTPHPLPTKPAFYDGLSQAALGRRLGKTSSTVAKSWNKGKTYFKAWSKKLDPDSIAWELRSTIKKGKYYFPEV